MGYSVVRPMCHPVSRIVQIIRQGTITRGLDAPPFRGFSDVAVNPDSARDLQRGRNSGYELRCARVGELDGSIWDYTVCRSDKFTRLSTQRGKAGSRSLRTWTTLT